MLVKAVFRHLFTQTPPVLKGALKPILIEIDGRHLGDLPLVLAQVRAMARPAFLFCDDLGFETLDGGVRELKSLLDGGLAGMGMPHGTRRGHGEGRTGSPSQGDGDENVGRASSGRYLLYATANRRHLMRRSVAEEQAELHETEAREEKIALSDRFGLWLGFHPISQQVWLEILELYFERLLASSSDAPPAVASWARRGSDVAGAARSAFGALGLAIFSSTTATRLAWPSTTETYGWKGWKTAPDPSVGRGAAGGWRLAA